MCRLEQEFDLVYIPRSGGGKALLFLFFFFIFIFLFIFTYFIDKTPQSRRTNRRLYNYSFSQPTTSTILNYLNSLSLLVNFQEKL